MLSSGTPYLVSWCASSHAGRLAPPASACWAMATICGLATRTATPAARADWRSAVAERARASQPASTTAASAAAMIAVSWLTRKAAPSTAPSSTARPRPGRRRSRTTVSRVSGKNSAPIAMLR